MNDSEVTVSLFFSRALITVRF